MPRSEEGLLSVFTGKQKLLLSTSPKMIRTGPLNRHVQTTSYHSYPTLTPERQFRFPNPPNRPCLGLPLRSPWLSDGFLGPNGDVR